MNRDVTGENLLRSMEEWTPDEQALANARAATAEECRKHASELFAIAANCGSGSLNEARAVGYREAARWWIQQAKAKE